MSQTKNNLKESKAYCRHILPKVSRTFALNINILTGDLHQAVLSGYLMCRIADTFEDSSFLSTPTKTDGLNYFLQLLDLKDSPKEYYERLYEPFASQDALHPYHQLIQNSHHVFTLYFHLSLAYQESIRTCLQDMCKGMIETLEKEDSNDKHTIITMNDLEQYCYYVAGTVGELLTKLFAIHCRDINASLQKNMQSKEVAFGQGLQLTNIIKDAAKDIKRGTCYIPLEVANRQGLALDDFFKTPHQDQALLALNELILKTVEYLDEALRYTLMLPRKAMRIRLFCLWPLLFAIETLSVAYNNRNLVTGQKPIKISRRTISLVMYTTTLLFWNDSWIKYRYRKTRRTIGLA